MANKKISELTSRTPALSDLMLVGDPSSGYSYKCTITALATIIETDIADGFVTIGTTQTISGAKTFSNNLTLTSVANTPTDPDKFLTLNASNVVTYRTGSQVLSDIGAQGSITLTTTGTSGAATLVGNTLNIPQYSPDLSGYVPNTRTLTINGTSYDLSANRTWSVGTVTSVAATAGTGISISGSPITSSGTLTITNTAPDQTVVLTAGTGISVSGTYPNFTITNSSPSLGGTVTSVGLSAPTGFSVTGSPVTSSGTLALAFASGYSLPTTASQGNWDSAYNNMIVSAAVTGTTTKTLTLTQQDAGTITASWTDDNSGTVTSVGLSAGTSGTDISVSGSPITSSGTITLNIPTASASNRGALSSADWTTFNNKQNAITLTTTGSSGSATFVSNTLNVPTYTLAGLGGISGSGTTNYIPKFTSSSAIGNSIMSEGSGVINVAGNLATNNTNGILTLANGNTSSGNKIQSFNSTGNANGYLAFEGYSSEYMRISSTGNVGIGTSSPNGKLQVKSGTNQNLVIGTQGGELSFEVVDDAYSANTPVRYYASTHNWYTGGLIKATLDASGNLGLGTTSTSAISGGYIGLFINGSSGSNIDFRAGGTGYGRVQADVNGLLFAGLNSVPITFFTGGTERMRISSTGNVSIGNTNNTYKLDVTGTLRVNTSGSDTYRNLLVTYPSTFATRLTIGASNFYIENDGSPETFTFVNTTGSGIFDWKSGASATQRMRLDGNGNLGLGVSPSAWLSTYRNLQIGLSSSIVGQSNDTKIIFNNNAYYSGSSQWVYLANSPAAQYTMADNNHFWYTAPSGTAGNAISFTQAMTLDASGRLAIGTTTANDRLTVSGRINILGTQQNSIWFNQNAGGTSTGFLVGRSYGSDNAQDFFIYDVAAAAARMFITSGGNVGIGTTSPGSLLDVVTSTAYDGVIRVRSTGTNTPIVAMGVDAVASPDGYVGTQNNVPFGIRTNDVNRIWVTNGGNVGIGTTSPNTILDVNGTINVRTNGYEFGRITTNNVTGNFGGLTFQYNASGTFTSGMVLTGGGNVGIGTTSPISASGYTGFTVYNATTGGIIQTTNGTVDERMQISSTAGYFGTFSNHDQIFTTNSTERMRITSGGELLINTTSDAGDYKLQVNGAIYSTNGTAENIWMNDGVASSSLQQASNIFFINGNASSATHASIVFRSSSAYTERMRITSGGNVEITTGSIKTGAPSGGTAKPWKLGEAGVTLGGSNTSGVRVEIDGTVYYLVTGYLP